MITLKRAKNITTKSDMLSCQPDTLLFKSTPENQSDTDVMDRVKETGGEEEQAEEQKVILCAFCVNAITDVSQIISVNGSHQHVFVNPHGLVFDTGCFKECNGCIVDPRVSSEFSWFHGYSWRIAGCGRCRQHLGWFFLSDHADSCHAGTSGAVGSSGSVDSSRSSGTTAASRQLYKAFYCLILENLIIP
ncbi:MAG: hypothetical protein HQK61_11330 [Desulfamplus sp.]|nr:hypothetical protein [Desulfamplus sp.]